MSRAHNNLFEGKKNFNNLINKLEEFNSIGTGFIIANTFTRFIISYDNCFFSDKILLCLIFDGSKIANLVSLIIKTGIH